jgi:hypothetical protein
MTSSPEACAHACPIRNHNAVTSVALSVEFSRSSTRIPTATLSALEIWSNGFIASRAPAPLASLPRSFFYGADLTNRTGERVAAMPVLLDSGSINGISSIQPS